MKTAHALAAADNAARALTVEVLRAPTGSAEVGLVRALDLKGLPLGEARFAFKADEREQIRRQLAGTLQAVICQRMAATVAGGMTPALEIMINTATVKKLIEDNRLDKLPAAIETGNDDGMINFNQSLFNLVKKGKVSEQEALSKATNAQALEMNFKGIFLNEGGRIVS